MNSPFSRDVQVKGMEQTVNHAEKYLGHFCTLLASYTRKTAKLRDKADLLVTQLFEFSSTEDPEFQIGFKNLAEDLAMVQDYRQAQVERLETRVVSPLKGYGDIIKMKRAELKKFSADRSRELKEIQKLEKIRLRNPADRQSISQAEVSAQKASNNAQRSTRQLEDTITDFQRQKLEDLKRVFTDFVTVEMLFHSKALEVYAHTLQNLETIDMYKDLELFNGRFRMSDAMPGPLDAVLTSRSTSSMSPTASPTRTASMANRLSPSLASTNNHSFLASTRGQSSGSTLASRRGRRQRQEQNQAPPRRLFPSKLQRQKGMEEEEEDEEQEEEEEEEDDEEMYESEMDEAQQSQRQSYSSQYVQSRRQFR